MMQRQTKPFVLHPLLLLVFLLVLSQATASAQAVNRLWITAIDTSAFPDVTVNFVAQGAEGQPITAVGALQVEEDGIPITDFTTERRETGIEVFFVIDANETITDDDGTDSSRRDDVVEAINLFVDDYMDPNQIDRVTIIVPPDDEHVSGILTQEAIFINEVKNQINFYNPDPDDPAPLNEMMFQALDLAAETQANGRTQVLVLFSDGALEDEPLDFDGIVSQANEQYVTIFAAILGERDDPDEIANMQQLYEPTNGAYVHMPNADALAPVLATIDSLSFQTQAAYRSSVNSGGEHTLNLNLSGATAEASFSVELEPPEVAILIDNSQPIIRVAADAETPLAEMLPTEQLVVAQVTFPDGKPRAIESISLSINGDSVSLPDDVQPDADGIIEFDWPLSDVDAGTYDLVLSVTDELGLEGANEPLPLTVEVDRPEAVPETEEPVEVEEPEDEEAVEEAAEAPESGNFLSENMGILGIVGGVLAIGVAFFILILAVVLVRRRSQPAVSDQPVTPTVAQAKPTSNLDADSTQIISPDFVLQQTAGAYLEVIEHASEHVGPIFIPGKNAAFGRDERVAQIVFKDKSVSRLHARIMESGGVYRLYDEGSASGTYHNFDRVGLTPHTLQDNDDIHFGRVHLRFHLNQGGAGGAGDDSTQIFGPGGAPMRPQAAGGDDGTSTQVFNPHDSSPAGRSSGPSHPSDEDPDDTSTQPFMPHH